MEFSAYSYLLDYHTSPLAVSLEQSRYLRSLAGMGNITAHTH